MFWPNVCLQLRSQASCASDYFSTIGQKVPQHHDNLPKKYIK